MSTAEAFRVPDPVESIFYPVDNLVWYLGMGIVKVLTVLLLLSILLIGPVL